MNFEKAIIASIGALLVIGLTGAAAAADQVAFNGPHSIPGRIQAEDYDNGGAGVAYYDTTAGNSGGAGRTAESVDVETANGITNIGWITDNEWTEYTVTVATGGTYTANFRIGSWANDRKVALTVDGAAGCTVTVPNTGSYEVFTTVSAPLNLAAGTHVLRLTYLGSGQNIDWFEIAAGTTPVVPTAIATSVSTQPGQTAYNGPHSMPGRVQAEDYDTGGQNVAYYDTTADNRGGAGRLNEAVDVRTINGVTDIAFIGENEWTEYTVTVATGGTYTANFRVGSPKAGHTVTVTVDGAQGCTVTVPNTGSYEVYATVSAPLTLTAGTHVIRLAYHNNLDGYGQSIDSFELVGAPTTAVPTTAVPTTAVPTTAVPTTTVPSAGTTISTTMSATQAAAMVTTARSDATARLAAKQAAEQAWAVPARPVPAGAVNAQLKGLKADGVTDNTAALQTLLNSLAAGSTIYFPKGTYKINGPVSITRPVTLFGEAGTIFNCQGATQYVFNINKAGSASAPMSGVAITGLVIEGPGLETAPCMIYGRYLQNFHVSYVKIHNVGYAGIRVDTCTDVLIDHCNFDNIFKTGYGYSICICDRSDRITIRDNFFVTNGRHYITTGTSNTNLAVADYTRSVLIENNYFEYSVRGAADTHPQIVGPLVVKNNVFYKCTRAVSLRGGAAEITDNVVFGSTTAGFYVYETTSAPTTATAVNKILRNKVFDSTIGVALLVSNDLVQDNIISGAASNGVWIRSDYWVPGQVSIDRNIIKGYSTPIKTVVPYAGITQTSNYIL